MESMEVLLQEAIRLSGPLKEGQNELYSSYHLPKLSCLKACRNTLVRLNQLNVPMDLRGRSVLDIGSNTGAVSFELAQRGAAVVGLEINSERVDLSNKLAKLLDLKVTFKQVDLNKDLPQQRFDFVFCLAIDAYIEDRESFYKWLAECTLGKCYLESNFPKSDSGNLSEEILYVRELCKSVFPVVKFLGLSTLKGRRLFVMSKHSFEMPRKPVEYKNGNFVKTFLCFDEWDNLRLMYDRIKKLPAIPSMVFAPPCTITTKLLKGVSGWSLVELVTKDAVARDTCRNQMIDFLIGINKLGYAHRDLHIHNLLFTGTQLFVLDWEFAAENKLPLEEAYDLTGKGYCSEELPGICRYSEPTTVFHRISLAPGSVIPSIGEIFKFTFNDVLAKAGLPRLFCLESIPTVYFNDGIIKKYHKALNIPKVWPVCYL